MDIGNFILTVFIVIMLSSSNCEYRLHGALVGYGTTIACEGLGFDGMDARSLLFWIINGTVYEVLSIHRQFPFISEKIQFASLNIPLVSSTLNNTTFQCARFGENGMENGTVICLQVYGETDTRITFKYNIELVLNYQVLYIQNNRTTVSWVLNDACSERFQVQGYTLDTGEPVLSPEHVFDVGNSTSVVLSEHVSNVSYKLVALTQNLTLCSSTREIYYKVEGVFTQSRVFNSSLCLVIPSVTLCPRGSINFVWPARAEGRSCVCPVHNSSAGRRVFESCVEGCRDAVLTPTLTEEGHVCIDNLNSSLNGSLLHFVCSTEECGGQNPCFLQTIISSYNIVCSECMTTSAFTQMKSPSVETTSFAGNTSSSSIAAAIVAPLLAFLLLLLLTFSLMICCYYYHQRKQCRTIVFTARKKNSGSMKRVAYNINYAITSPQTTQESVTESYDNFTKPPDLVYNVIPGERSALAYTFSAETQQIQTRNDGVHDVIPEETRCSFVHTFSAELQPATGNESSLSRPQESHDGLYDVIPGESSGELQQTQMTTGTENPPSLPQENHDGLYDVIPGDASSAELQQIRTVTGNENPPSLPQRNHDKLHDVIPRDHEASTDFDDNDSQSTYNHLIYKPPTHCAITTPDQGPCDKTQESKYLEKNISSSKNEAGDNENIDEPTYSTLEQEQKVSEHLYSVVNKEAKKKHQLVMESDEENEMEITTGDVNKTAK